MIEGGKMNFLRSFILGGVSLLACGLASAQQNFAGPSTPSGSLSFTPAAIVNVLDARCIGAACTPGAKGDGTLDDWKAIQIAMGMNSSGICTYTQPTTVVIPPTITNAYRISQALRLCSNVTLWTPSNATRILCAGDATGTDYTGGQNTGSWPTNACTLPGSALATAIAGQPTYTVTGAVAPGKISVALSTAGAGANFAKDDVVLIEDSTATFTIGTQVHAAQLRGVKITGVSGDTLTFERPIDFTASAVQVRKLSNLANSASWPTLVNSAGQNTNIPMFAWHDGAVIGGTWVASSAAPWDQAFSAAGGAVDVVMSPHRVDAGYGSGYINAIFDSYFSADSETIYSHAIEQAFGSSYNVTRIANLQIALGTENRREGGFAVAEDEGAHGNVVDIGAFDNTAQGQIPQVTYSGTVTGGGGDAVTASVTSPGMNAGAPVTVTYTTLAGDTFTNVATGVAAALNANATITAAGFAAIANTTGVAGVVTISNSNPTVFGYLTAGSVNSIVGSVVGQDTIRIVDASDNDVTVHTLTGATTGYLVNVQGFNYTGTPPATERNTVKIVGATQAAYNGAAIIQGPSTNDNNVIGGFVKGLAWTPASALQFSGGIGSRNTISGWRLNAVGSLDRCNVVTTDRSNTFKDTYTNLIPSTDLLGANASFGDSIYCTFSGVTWDALLAVRTQGGVYGRTIVTSAGAATWFSQFAGSSSVPLDVGTGFEILADLKITGTAATKTGSVAWWGCSISYTIPAAATLGQMRAIYSYHTVNSQHGTLVIDTDAGQATGSCTTSHPGTTSSRAAVTMNATTSSDQVIVDRLSMRPMFVVGDTVIAR